MDVGGCMAQYYDCAAFENFVKELYEEEGEVIVQRDVRMWTDMVQNGRQT